MTAREFFPHMPEEVWAMWLEPIIAEYGWPFTSVHDSLEGTKLKYVLCNVPLVDWQGFRWQMQSLPFQNIICTGKTVEMIKGIIGNAVPTIGHSQPNEFGLTMAANVSDTKQRFRAFTQIIEDTGDIPLPIVGRFDSTGALEIIDGWHRLAALIYMRPILAADFRLRAWIPYCGHSQAGSQSPPF